MDIRAFSVRQIGTNVGRDLARMEVLASMVLLTIIAHVLMDSRVCKCTSQLSTFLHPRSWIISTKSINVLEIFPTQHLFQAIKTFQQGRK